MRSADLHLHTTASDGTYTPQAVVETAATMGFEAISICDHDSVAGIEDALSAGEAKGIEVLAGVELSSGATAGSDEKEVHLLGYLIDWKHGPLVDALDQFREVRRERLARMIGKLEAAGCPLGLDEVMNTRAEGSVGRLHVARALVDKGYVATVHEAFDRYLGRGRLAFEEKARLTPAEAVALIRAAGGVPVVAHPALLGSDELVERLLDEGAMGLEAYYSRVPPSVIDHYCQIARRRGVLITGGSDCHQAHDSMLLGTVRLPYRHVMALKAKHRELAAARPRA